MATDSELAAALFAYARAHYTAEEAWHVAIEARAIERECLDQIHRLVPKEQ
jgi:hemerythrin